MIFNNKFKLGDRVNIVNLNYRIKNMVVIAVQAHMSDCYRYIKGFDYDVLDMENNYIDHISEEYLELADGESK